MSDLQPGNRVEAFRVAMLRRGINGSDIARMLGVSRQLVSRVVRGETRSAKVERKLASIFPEVATAFPFEQASGSSAVPTHGPAIVAAAGGHGNCTCVQGVSGQPERPDPERDPRVRAAAELTLRQRELLAAVRDAGGRVRLGDLQGFCTHVVCRIARELRNRGYLRGPELIVLDSQVELVEVA